MSTPWITIAADDLNAFSVGAKMNALRTAALKPGQGDPFLEVMPAVVATMRMQIQSCKANTVSATANSLPPELKTHACWLIIQAMQARLPGVKLTDEEKDMIKKADMYMAAVARCDYAVAQPEDPITTPQIQGGNSPRITPKTKNFTACDQDGI